MGIDVLDDIIIGDKNYLSLKRQGLFFKLHTVMRVCDDLNRTLDTTSLVD